MTFAVCVLYVLVPGGAKVRKDDQEPESEVAVA